MNSAKIKDLFINIMPKIVFTIQLGSICYLFLGLSIISILSHDSSSEWIFWINISAILLVLLVFFIQKSIGSKLKSYLIYIVLNFIYLFIGILYILLTVGTEFLIQTIEGFLFIIISAISLFFLIYPNFKVKRQDLRIGSQNAKLAKVLGIILIILTVNGIFSFFGYFQQIVLKPTNNEIKISLWGTWNVSVYQDEFLDDLEQHGCDLYVFFPIDLPERDQTYLKQFENSMEVFETRGIDIYLANGPTIENAEDYKNGMIANAEFLLQKRYSCVKGFVHDIEWPHSLIKIRDEYVKDGNYLGIGRQMFERAASNRNMEETKAIYSEMNSKLNELGFKTIFVGMFWEHDDSYDGDQSLEKLFQMPSVPPNNYDFYNYMIYRTDTGRYDYDPYFTYNYINQLVNRYDINELTISLGCLNLGVLEDWDELVEEIRICKDLAVKEVILFYYSGLIEGYGYNPSVVIDELVEEINDDREIVIQYDRLMSIENKVMNLIDLLI